MMRADEPVAMKGQFQPKDRTSPQPRHENPDFSQQQLIQEATLECWTDGRITTGPIPHDNEKTIAFCHACMGKTASAQPEHMQQLHDLIRSMVRRYELLSRSENNINMVRQADFEPGITLVIRKGRRPRT